MGILVPGDNVASLVFGGIGGDTANYATSLAAVQVDMNGVITGGAAQGDIFVSIGNVTGSIFGDASRATAGATTPCWVATATTTSTAGRATIR